MGMSRLLSSISVLCLLSGIVQGQTRCKAVSDIVLLLDGSFNITNSQFDLLRKFASDLTKSMAVGPTDALVSAVVYNNVPRIQFYLNKFNANEQLAEALLSVTRVSANVATFPHLALNTIYSIGVVGPGSRKYAAKIAILVAATTSFRAIQTSNSIALLKKNGITLLVVAIGKPAYDELSAFVASPQDIFAVPTFDDLKNIRSQVALRTCKVNPFYEENDGPVAVLKPCNTFADIVIAIDSSRDVGINLYKKELQLVSDLIAPLTLGPDKARFHIVLYTNVVQKVLDFNTYSSMTEISRAILSSPYLQGPKVTYQALNYPILRKIFTPAQGSRIGSKHVFVLVSGSKSDNMQLAVRFADRLKADGVKVLTVGFSNANEQELKFIASTPEDALMVEDMDTVKKITPMLSKKICSAVNSIGGNTETEVGPVDEQETTGGNTNAPKPCRVKADIIFCLDSSGSIGRVNYDKQLRFAAELASSFQIGAKDTCFGAVLFSYVASKMFDLKDNLNQKSVAESLLSLPYMNSTTNTDKALSLIEEEGMFEDYSGGRNDAAKIVILITDGRSNNPTKTAEAAQSLKDMDVDVISIGIGRFESAELQAVASEKQNVFQVTSYQVLDKIKEQVAARTCQGETAGGSETAEILRRLLLLLSFDACFFFMVFDQMLKMIRLSLQVLILVIIINQSTGAVVEKVNCNAVADIEFLMDGSFSIKKNQFILMRRFVADLTRKFNIGRDKVQFGATVFNDIPRKVFSLKRYVNNDNLAKALLNTRRIIRKHVTMTHLALNFVTKASLFGAAEGGRSHATKIIILLSDGNSSKRDLTLKAANRLKKSGIKILTVAIGKASYGELRQVASSDRDVFTAANFEALGNIRNQLAERTCRIPAEEDNKPVILEPCPGIVDIVAVVDGSSSVGRENFKKQLEFVAALTKPFTFGASNGARIAALVFSSEVRFLFGLNTYSSQAEISQAILKAPFIEGGTKTYKALNYIANKKIFDPSNGGRPNARKIVFVLTDGKSDSMPTTVQAADRLKKQGVTIIAVGVSKSNVQELKFIASSGEYVLRADNHELLNKIKRVASQQICDAVTKDDEDDDAGVEHVTPPDYPDNDENPAPPVVPTIPPPPKPCPAKADILFVLDSSGSIGPVNYQKQRQFAAEVASNFPFGEDGARFACIIFSYLAEKMFDFQDKLDSKSVTESLLSLPYMNSTTNTDKALRLVLEEEMFEEGSGGRDDASKLIVFMTDGRSRNTTATIEAAQQIKDDGIAIISIGIGQAVKEELEGVASDKRNVFQVASFEALSKIKQEVANRACQVHKEPRRAKASDNSDE
ncbi:collagen alpha-6(VI) chain-like [Physella acuta]|uniref:collagen alpha-6(VI) chain-like n=1 Tax=Physella acuta TaxID=109671 RepID=UPI0027DB1F71|nr:collagen alpha-6(VI) chain-like [Physella acuta]